MSDRLETLFEGWSAGELATAEQAELRQLLQDPAAADRFVLLCGERQDLRAGLIEPASDTGPAIGRRLLAFTSVGLVAAAVLVAVWFSLLERVDEGQGQEPVPSAPLGEVLLGYDFSSGRARQFGAVATPISWSNRQDGLRYFVGEGLAVSREDYVAVHNPADAEAFLARLQAAEVVTLQVRVRFASAIPADCNLATLLCMEPADPDRRFLPLRWPGAAMPAGPTVHQVSLTLHRDGRQVHRIDGDRVRVTQRPWLFDDWRGHWALLLHTHRPDAGMPIELVFESLRILVD